MKYAREGVGGMRRLVLKRERKGLRGQWVRDSLVTLTDVVARSVLANIQD